MFCIRYGPMVKYGAALLERMRPMYPIASPELQWSALATGQTRQDWPTVAAEDERK